MSFPTDVIAIKRYLAQKYGLRLLHPDNPRLCRIDQSSGEVPDGEHLLPLGARQRLTKVVVRGGNIEVARADWPREWGPPAKETGGED